MGMSEADLFPSVVEDKDVLEIIIVGSKPPTIPIEP